VVMWQHNIWCVCVGPVWRGMHTSPNGKHTHTHTHTKCYAATSPH